MIATAVKAPYEIVRLINTDPELMRAVQAFIESDLGEDKRQYIGPPTIADVVASFKAVVPSAPEASK